MASDRGVATPEPDHLEADNHHLDVLRSHGYHLLKVKRVIQETADTKSFVLDVPEELAGTFRYRPGQFCTFRVHIAGGEHLRSYSMSSAPETDDDLVVTVKRVPGGLVSNWFLDHVAAGDVLETTRPAGVFCLGEADTAVMAFCGGSGVTPVMSVVKGALASTERRVRVVYANRDRESVIFAEAFDTLQAVNVGRLHVHHHIDSDAGFLDAGAVRHLVSAAAAAAAKAEAEAEAEAEADFYICGPGPFMDLVESTLLDLGVAPERIFIERFIMTGQPSPQPPVDPIEAPATPAAMTPATVTVIMKGRRTEVAYQRGDTLLETARRGALQPPFSCESGNCATCMAMLREGSATMRVNNALTAEEVAEGWVLTCQAIPTGPTVVVEYEAM